MTACGNRAPGAGEQLDAVVEHRGIAAGRLDDRMKLVNVFAEQWRGEQFLARVHPVDVAAQRVDFAVMGDEAIRVRAIPARERVGGEALMHHRQRGHHFRDR